MAAAPLFCLPRQFRQRRLRLLVNAEVSLMSAKTKIVVLRMKEIIYTAVFAGLALLLVALFFIMFRRDRASSQPANPTQEASYIPGVYSASIQLANEQINVEVTVDADEITSVALKPLSESVTAMYPLVEPAMQDLAGQILDEQSLESVTCQEDQKYTASMLLKAIDQALSKARIDSSGS